MELPKDSPVEVARKENGYKGDGNWPGYDKVWHLISEAAMKMARTKGYYLSEAHIQTMADLGSGHEEQMKWRLMWLRTYGWID